MKKFSLCKQNQFSFENMEHKILPFQKIFIHKVLTTVQLKYSDCFIQLNI